MDLVENAKRHPMLLSPNTCSFLFSYRRRESIQETNQKPNAEPKITSRYAGKGVSCRHVHKERLSVCAGPSLSADRRERSVYGGYISQCRDRKGASIGGGIIRLGNKRSVVGIMQYVLGYVPVLRRRNVVELEVTAAARSGICREDVWGSWAEAVAGFGNARKKRQITWRARPWSKRRFQGDRR